MNLGEFAIKRKTSTLVVTVLMVLGGIFSYFTMGRLEDPEFTLKDAIIVTSYPGATAEEVEREVTDLIERAVQQMGDLKEVESSSQPGLSTVQATMVDSSSKKELPQIWNELRNKVGDVQNQLPPGAGPSIVMDDFSDVYGVFLAITGQGYSYQELKQAAKYLQRELLLVDDVARITLSGERAERVYVEMSRDKLAQFGLSTQMVLQILASKNLVVNAGQVYTETEALYLRPSGAIDSVEEMRDLVIGQPTADGPRVLRLGDIAEISRGYVDPPRQIFRVNGQPAIGLAISTAEGGNVVRMGEALQQRLDELLPSLPFGIEIHKLSMQSDAVTKAVNSFMISLGEAVLIVIAVLMVSMGLKSGLLIGVVLVVLLVTIAGTLIGMKAGGILMERVSLGALIIALGMLVDNAIVVTEGMMIGLRRGEGKLEAAKAVVGQNALPLFGATLVTILAFGSIGLSDNLSGEYSFSLFFVILVSLLISWVTAVTITPLFSSWVYKPQTGERGDYDPYGGGFFQIYRRFLVFCLRHSKLVVTAMIVLLAVAGFGFGLLDDAFFPDSTRPQFQIDVWLPEGTHIYETERMVKEFEDYLSGVEHITGVASSIGRGVPRFILTYNPEGLNPAYAYLLVSVDDYQEIERLKQDLQRELERRFPNTMPVVYKFNLGPSDPTPIQARFSGPDKTVLRDLAEQAMAIMHADGEILGIQHEWRAMVKGYRPVLHEVPARNLGIESSAVSGALQAAFDGSIIGMYRERDELIPIVARAPEEERSKGVPEVRNLWIWSPIAGQNIPLQQVISGYETIFEDSQIKRFNRTRSILVQGAPVSGLSSSAVARIQEDIETIELPEGYSFEWDGEVRQSREARESLLSSFPFFVLLMVLITVFLFDALRPPLLIWLCVPLILIGVVGGLLFTDQPFNVVALMGLLSLTGMLIKNAIVLLDQINLEIRAGKPKFEAVVDSGVNRMRPVMMAAMTTVLGMAPLLVDPFFKAMAVTIMAGLTFATVLTLVVVPVLYTMFYKVDVPPKASADSAARQTPALAPKQG